MLSFTVMNRPTVLLLPLLLSMLFLACGEPEATIPRPRGYFRIDFPAKAYQRYTGNCPFAFDYPLYAQVRPSRENQPCWPNIEFLRLRARLHLSYRPVEGNLPEILEDSRTLTYKHTVRANDIREKLYSNPESRVYGTLYEVSGNAASAIQFHLTDSSRHFIRGSLYFDAAPNADSLAPVVEFLRSDINRLIESFSWQN